MAGYPPNQHGVIGPGPQGGVIGMPQMPRVPFGQNQVLTALGTSLLAGRGTLSGAAPYLAQTMPAAMQGNQQYREAIVKKQQDAADMARKHAAMNAVLKRKSGISLSPEENAALAAMPEIALQFFPEAPKRTDDMLEFDEVKRDPAFGDHLLKLKQAGGTTFNVGPTGIKYPDPQAGYDYARNPDGTVRLEADPGSGAMVPRLVAIPGGKPATEAASADAATDVKNERQAVYTDVVLEDIKRAKALVKESPWYAPTAGFGAEFLAENVGGSAAANVKQLINTVSSSISFDRLQAMREASPTGGALGAVTERELALLQSTLGSLSQMQDPEQLAYNLERVEEIYTNIMSKFAAYPNAAQYGFGAPAAGAPAPTSGGGRPAGVYDWSPDDGSLRPAQ